MTVRKPLTLTLIAFAIAAPGLASASSLYHPADGEVGMTTHPDHMQSTMSSGDVLQAVEVARRDGTLATLSRGGALPVKATGATKTREQVQQEFLNMSASEKKALQDLNGVRTLISKLSAPQRPSTPERALHDAC